MLSCKSYYEKGKTRIISPTFHEVDNIISDAYDSITIPHDLRIGIHSIGCEMQDDYLHVTYYKNMYYRGKSTQEQYMNKSCDSGNEQLLILSSNKMQPNEHFRYVYHGAQLPDTIVRIISLEPKQPFQKYCPLKIPNSTTHTFIPICLPGLYNIECTARSENGTIKYSENFTVELQGETLMEYGTSERFSLHRKMMYLFYSVLWFLILHLSPSISIYGQRNRNLRRLVQKQFIHKHMMYDRAELIIECIPCVYIAYSDIGRIKFNRLSLAIMRHLWMLTEGPSFILLWTTCSWRSLKAAN